MGKEYLRDLYFTALGLTFGACAVISIDQFYLEPQRAKLHSNYEKTTEEQLKFNQELGNRIEETTNKLKSSLDDKLK